ncbi:MAG: deoxyguanosinetriphosphate triphosphohydrolase [Planctomycetes bacterium]|nr:deoxyguanosinetriphosphate triphosphohydrolase [Planctomycetota bacterium]
MKQAAFLNRLAKEERERRDLAPWARFSAESAGRREPEAIDPMRTVYERDRDRITHSTAFRRLMYKTQVFLNEEGDHNRTRLSHSLEVCQVARSIGGALRLNEALCETLGLAHDLGHPPFGHRGERALDDLMADHGGFRHNAQVLRVADQLERRSPDYRGLNLTCEVRAGLLKHEADRDWPEDLLPRHPRPCLEAQVVDLADSSAYNKHDLEDGLLAGMFQEEDLRAESSLWRRAEAQVNERHPGFLAADGDNKLRVSRVTNEVLGICISDLIESSQLALDEAQPTDAEAAQQHGSMLICHGTEIAREVAELHKFLYQHFYCHEHLERFLTFARKVLDGLWTTLRAAPDELPEWYQNWAQSEGLERAVCDYMAGMTDRFALREHERLVGPLPGGFTPLSASTRP